MAIAMLFELPGGTQEQYDAVLNEVGTSYPGRQFHVAGPVEGGWRVVDVWESQEAFDRFFNEKLGKALRNVGMAQPQVTVFPVHNLLYS